MEFHQRISNSVKAITDDYEIILVNDGSSDDSLQIAKNLLNTDIKVNIIDLSRNFGHHKAIMTGLAYSQGDYVFLIDSDLEEEPELLGAFWKEIHNNKDCDVIYGTQKKKRKGGLAEKLSGWVFYKILNYLSEIKITENLVVARIMTKRYVKNLLKHTERELAFVGIAALTGFKQKALPVIKKDKGVSNYSFRKKINLAVNFITSLTNKPLVYIFYLGLCFTLLSLGYSIYLISKKIFFGINVAGWISTVISIWLLGGITIFCLGIIGIYISKIFIEVKQRPYTIIREIYSKNANISKKEEIL